MRSICHRSGSVRDRYGRHTFGQSVLLAASGGGGTRFVQVNWPSWRMAIRPRRRGIRMRRILDRCGICIVQNWTTLSALLEDMDSRVLLDETLVVVAGEFGRSPRMGVSTSGNGNAPDGRDHWPYCYTALVAGAGVSRGSVYGESDDTGSTPVEKPVHPRELLATVYHALGIDPGMEVFNHLGQPRELVKGSPVFGIYA